MKPHTLRHVVVGAAAGVFSMHRAALKLPIVDLVAMADVNEEAGQKRAAEWGCQFYQDYRQMLAEIRPDVAVIITPHTLHAQIAIDCLHAGCHVLVEKPMALQVAEADEMIDLAQSQQRVLMTIFQHRFRREILTAHKLLQEGNLGEIQHVALECTWPRPDAYYQQAGWRGTWKGEGGGILMNQGCHNIDILCHLLGMPTKLYAWTRTNYHHIETEDTAQAMLQWPNGAVGTLYLTTAAAGQPELLEIIGSKGRLVIEQGHLHLSLFEQDFKEYAASRTEPFAPLHSHPTPIKLETGTGDHAAVYQHFHQTIINGNDLNTIAQQGRMSLELANAMIYSSHTHSEVNLPLDRHKYTNLLQSLVEAS